MFVGFLRLSASEYFLRVSSFSFSSPFIATNKRVEIVSYVKELQTRNPAFGLCQCY